MMTREDIARMSTAELVGLVMGSKDALVAQRVLTRFAHSMFDVGVGELAEIEGVTPVKAARLIAAIQLGIRAQQREIRTMRICSSKDVDALLRPRLGLASQEHFVALPLDAKNRVMGEIQVAVGGLTTCPVVASDVYRAVVREAASAVIFVHNHPSGDTAPSPEDLALTKRLVRAGELIGVRVLDHVILGHDGYFSFLDSGMLTRSA